MKMKLIALILFLTFVAIKTDAVCDLRTLKVELHQDLDDNGVLDCERKIEPKHFVEETEDEKNKRLAAQWDTACAFETTENYKDKLSTNYDIPTLVDVYGEPKGQDFEDQADMCEIVRAAMKKALEKYIRIDDKSEKAIELKRDFIERIDCAGPPGVKDGPRICAATRSSYFKKESCAIFVYSSNITVNILFYV
jgi:hypothetical protein